MSEAKITLTAVDKTAQAIASAKAGLQGLHVSATSVKAAFAGMGAAGALFAFGGMVKGAIDAADQLNKLSQRTGVATEKLSELQFAAKLSDVSADSLTTAMRKLNVSIADGLAGDKQKLETFRRLGIALRDANGNAITADKALVQMANTFSTAKDGATKTAYAVDLMGKAGDEMIPLLNGGGQAIEDLMTKARKMGLTISTDFAKQAEEFNDNLTILRTSSQKLAIMLAGDVVEGWGKAAKAMADAAVEGGKFKALLAGIDTLLFGDREYQNNVKIVETTDAILSAQKKLDRARAAGDEATVKRMSKIIETYQMELAMLRALSKELEGPAKGKQPKQDGKLPDPPKTGGETKISEYQRLNEEMRRAALNAQAELDWGGKLSASEKFRVETLAKITKAYKEGSPEREKAIAQLQQTVGKLKEGELAESERAQAMQIATERQKEKNEGYAQAAILEAQLRDEEHKQNIAARDYLQQVEFEISLIGMSNEQREVAIAMRELERQGIKEGTLAWEEYSSKIAAAVQTRSALQQAMDRFQSIWQSVDQTAHDVFVNIFEGGSNLFKKLGQALKASVLDLLYQMSVRPFLINVVANVTGASGSMAQAAMGASGGGAGSLASNALSLAGSSVFGSAGAYAAAVPGLSAGGAQAAMLAAQTGEFGLAGLTSTAAAGGSGMAAGLAAIPGWGWALAGAALLAGGLFGKSHGPKTESSFGIHSNGRGDPSGAQTIVDALQLQYGGAASALGLSDKTLSNVGAYYATDPNGTAKTQLAITAGSYDRGAVYGGIENVGRTDAELTAATKLSTLQATFVNLQEAIGKEGLTGKLADLVMSVHPLTDSLEDMESALVSLQDIGALNQALDAMGPKFASLKDLSVEATEALIKEAGGVESLTAQLSGYFSDFVTENEKHQIVLQQLTQTFADANVALPDSREGFRQAVEAALAIGDTHALQTLLGAEQAFNQLYPAIDDTASAATKAATAMNDWQASYFASWSTISKASENAKASAQFASDILARVGSRFHETVSGIKAEIDSIRGGWLKDGSADSARAIQQQYDQALATVMSGGRGASAAAANLPALAERLRAAQAAGASSLVGRIGGEAAIAQQLQNALVPIRSYQREQSAQLGAALLGRSSGGFGGDAGAVLQQLNRHMERQNSIAEQMLIKLHQTGVHIREQTNRGVYVLPSPSGEAITTSPA